MSQPYVELSPRNHDIQLQAAAMLLLERIKTLKWDKETKKCMFYLFNICFLVLGIGSTAVGVWLYLEKNDFLELTPSNYSALSAAGLCVFTGIAVCLISLVGCAGSHLENRCLVLTYVIFVCILTLVQAVTGTTGLFHKETSRERVRLDLLKNINRTHVGTPDGKVLELKYSWDHLQTSLSCCGADNYTDWYYSVQWPLNQFVPDSCCDPNAFASEDDMHKCGKIPTETDNFYQRGCYKVFADWLFHHVQVVSTVSFTLLVNELLVLIASICLLWQLHKEHTRGKYRKGVGISEERKSRMRSVSEAMS